MADLWLNFTDADGSEKRVPIASGVKFVIGRHSECDLTVHDQRLSRQHVRVEGFGSQFVISDCGSSNGTEINGRAVVDPVALSNGDTVSLGGFEIRVEIVADAPVREIRARKAHAETMPAEEPASGIPTFIFIIAPLLGILILVCGGGAAYYFSADNGRAGVDGRETPPIYIDDSPKTQSPTPTDQNRTPSPSPKTDKNDSPEPRPVDDADRAIEANSAAFLQKIALSDPTAFLKATEIALVKPKIQAFRGSSSLASALGSLRQDAPQIKSLAESKGLKPEFLAAAALAHGGGRPVETARQMLPALGELRVTLDNNLADDNLLIIAAYNQGKAGKFKELRNVLEALGKKNAAMSPREIRSIWFLKREGKLNDAEFDLALRFLAVGTIMQNPKDFGVSSEKITF
jgi:pSer/pThr/pTyr-binding forkhead associated (FHA) protein